MSAYIFLSPLVFLLLLGAAFAAGVWVGLGRDARSSVQRAASDLSSAVRRWVGAD